MGTILSPKKNPRNKTNDRTTNQKCNQTKQGTKPVRKEIQQLQHQSRNKRRSGKEKERTILEPKKTQIRKLFIPKIENNLTNRHERETHNTGERKNRKN